MPKIAVIGAEFSILPFRLLGVDVFPAKSADAALEILKKISGEYSIIFVEELFIKKMEDFLSEFDMDVANTIIPLPLQGKSSGSAIKRIKGFIREAIGISQ